MFSPLSIGALQLPSNIIQGPLAGVSCAPFRTRFYEYTPPAYCVTEMISALEVVKSRHRLRRYLARNPIETRLCYQLSGTDPMILAEACRILQDLGADLIDLNCGCPKAKIRKKGAGSKLVESEVQLSELISAMRGATSLPLTVKIRLHPDCADKELRLAKSIEESGADALIVHGRSYLDDYDKAVNHQRIRAIKEVLLIPLIANGDVKDLGSFKELVKNTQADGVMVGRAGCGRPWLYHSLTNSTFKPNLDTQVRLFQAHLKELAELESDYSAFLQAKNLVKYYFRDFVPDSFIQAFRQAKSFQEQAQFLYQL
jgi:nifR3 family TIM-barrel protein